MDHTGRYAFTPNVHIHTVQTTCPFLFDVLFLMTVGPAMTKVWVSLISLKPKYTSKAGETRTGGDRAMPNTCTTRL